MVMPLGDDNFDRRRFPIVNVVLIVINVAVFVLLQGMSGNNDFTYAYSTVPAEILSGRDIVTEDRLLVADVQGQRVEVSAPGLKPTPVPVYLTLITSMFMHGGIMHLLGNMWFLWIFGDNIEDDMGRPRYLLFYLLCGILASLAHVFTNTAEPGSLVPSLGASGAISGVMGAYLLLHMHRRVTILFIRIIMQVPGYVAVGLWFGFQIISSMGLLGDNGGVAYAAHIGGFIVGAALAYPFMIGRSKPPRYEMLTP
jgi:membrane associated rhomboid family serine protease